MPENPSPAVYQPAKRLAGKFGRFRRLMGLDEAPPLTAVMMQGAYIAGAQAAFQILHAASAETPEKALIIWGELQDEILQAMPKPAEKPLVEVPKLVI